MQAAWPCYRLFTEGKATLTELHETLSIDDVEKACEALDIVAAAEKRAADRAKSKSKGRHR